MNKYLLSAFFFSIALLFNACGVTYSDEDYKPADGTSANNNIRLTLDEKKSALLRDNNDSFYSFYISDRGNYTISASNLSKSANIDFQLYTQSDYTSQIDSAYNTSTNGEILTQDLFSGYYYLRVYQDNNDSFVNFDLKVTTNSIVFISDGTIDNPEYLYNGTTDDLKLAADDFSYFEFYVSTIGEHTIDVLNLSTSADIDIYVYRYDAFTDEMGKAETFYQNGESLTMDFTEVGTYYLKLDNDSNVDVTHDILITAPQTHEKVDLSVSATLVEADENIYYFDAISGTDYLIKWEDSVDAQDETTLEADILVSVYREDSTTLYEYGESVGDSIYDFLEQDDGYSTDYYIRALADEEVIIKVKGYNQAEAGTFSITVKEQ